MTRQEISERHYRKRKDNGLCPRCGKELDREGHYCSECLAKNREYRKNNRLFYKQNGLCSACGKEKAFGDEMQCISCREKHRRRKKETKEQRERYNEKFKEYSRNLYKERIEQGICPRCGKRKVAYGRKKCQICLNKDAERHREKSYKKRNERDYRIENHLCWYCGEPAMENKKICLSCHERCTENGKKSLRKNDYWKQDNKIIFMKNKKGM